MEEEFASSLLYLLKDLFSLPTLFEASHHIYMINPIKEIILKITV
jgi:hypothetical protein